MSGDDGEIMCVRYGKKLSLNKIFKPVKKGLIVTVAAVALLQYVFCFADDNTPPAKVPPPVLKKAVLCEKVINSTKPVNVSVVFSSSIGRLICFTYFDPVYEETLIYHKYYFNDKLSSKFALKLMPPRYATQSSIQLRESDKGPWRVEITDADGNILDTIRFSITD